MAIESMPTFYLTADALTVFTFNRKGVYTMRCISIRRIVEKVGYKRLLGGVWRLVDRGLMQIVL